MLLGVVDELLFVAADVGLELGHALLEEVAGAGVRLGLLLKVREDERVGDGVHHLRGHLRVGVSEIDVDEARVLGVRAGPRLLDGFNFEPRLEEVDVGVEPLRLDQVFACGGRGDRARQRQLIRLLRLLLLRRLLLQPHHAQEVLPGRALLPRARVQERRVVFEVECFNDAPEESGTRQVLELRVEVGRVARRVVDDDHAALAGASARRVVLEVDLHARPGRIDVGLLRDVDRRRHRRGQRDPDDQPQVLADGAQVLADVVLLTLFTGAVIASVMRRWQRRVTYRSVKLSRLGEAEYVILVFHNISPGQRMNAGGGDQKHAKSVPRVEGSYF